MASMYCGIENDSSPVPSSLYLFFFLSLYIFVKYISTNVLHKKFISCIQVYNDKLYRGIENQPSLVFSSLNIFTFHSLHAFSTIIFRQRYL